MSKEYVIQTHGLTHYYGNNAAIQSLNLKVPKGSVFGFLGRNGSGKTTTIRILLGLLSPARGSSTILGEDSQMIPPETKGSIGYMTESHFVYEWMNVGECVRFQSSFYPNWNQKLFDAVIDHFDLTHASQVKDLSRGERAGLSLGLTLAPDPELLILDDPALGLDPLARKTLMEAMVFLTRKSNRTIFFSSHHVTDVERVADEIAILDKSILRACCPLQTFQEKVKDIMLTFDGPPPEIPLNIGLLQSSISEKEMHLTVSQFGDATMDALHQLNPSSMQTIDLSLEDAVTSYLGRQGKRSLFTEQLEKSA